MPITRKRKTKTNPLIIYIFLNIIALIISFFLPYLSLIIILVSLISSFIIIKEKQQLAFYITFIISLIIIIISTILIYKNLQENIDINKDTNILLGSWTYNDDGGTYVFNKDYTYYQYTNKDTTNNYCQGTYKYYYGAKDNKHPTLRQDENYYYYTLTLNEEKCLIMNKEFIDEYKKILFIGYSKNNKNTLTVVNKENNNLFSLNKSK